MNRRQVMGMLGAAAAGLTTSVSQAADAPMLARKIPSSGELLPVVGMGTWQTFDAGDDKVRRAQLEQLLGEFAALGGAVIDSSPMYGSSEEVAGALAHKLQLRPRLFIATKVWTQGRAAGIAQMNDSMAKLQARPIDLMQVHNLVAVDTHLATLRDWKRDGIVRHVGVTHYTASAHDAVARIVASQPLDFIQINYSAGEREAEQRLLPLARERGVAVIANRPFAGGDVLRRLRGVALPPWAADIDCRSWAQVLLKYVLSHPAITCAIPATTKLEHLRDNMQAGHGRMPDAKLRALIAAQVNS